MSDLMLKPEHLSETTPIWHSIDCRAGLRARPAESGIGTVADPTLAHEQRFHCGLDWTQAASGWADT